MLKYYDFRINRFIMNVCFKLKEQVIIKNIMI